MSNDEQYHALVDSLPSIMGWTCGPQGDVQHCNQAVLRYTGVALEELIGERWLDVLHPHDRQPAVDAYRKCLQTGTPLHIEVRLRAADGSYRWFSCRVLPLRDGEGKVVQWIGTNQDLEEVKLTSQALHIAESRFQAIMDQAPHPVIVVSKEGRIRVCNAAWRALHEATPSDYNVLEDPELPKQGEAALYKGRWLRRQDYPVTSPHGEVTEFVVIFPEFTEQKRAEEQRILSERRFRSIIEKSREILAVLTAEGELSYVSPAMERILGYRTEGTLRSRPSEWTHPEDIELVETRLKQVLEQPGGTLSWAQRAITVKGDVLWLQIGATNLLDEPGVNGIVVNARDVTEERRAAETMARDALILSNVRDSVVVTDLEGRVTYWNGGAERTFGWTADEMLGKCLLARFPESRHREIRDFMNRFRTGETHEGLFEDVHRDGTPVWIEGQIGPIRDQGRHVGTLAVSHDVTERVKAEAELRLRTRAMDAVRHGVIIAEAKGDFPIVHVNEGFRLITGYSKEEAIGKNCRFLQGKDTDPAALALVRQALASGSSCQVELLNYRKDGTSFWNALTLAPIRDSAGQLTHIVGVQTDVSERRALESQFMHAQKMEAVGRLAGGIAHDFNNLLTISMATCDLLREELQGQPELLELVDQIREAGTRSAALTRKLLTFSRKQMFSIQLLDLNHLVGSLDRMLRRFIGEDVELITLLEAEEPVVRGDATQLEQVVMNLAVNARDAMPDGGKLILQTRNVVRERQKYVMLAVRDTGSGLSPEVRSRMFEPFFTTKEPGKGTGLGLSVVHGVVKQSDGHLDVESEIGVGTTFRIFLPIAV